jgi:hypothetical protein
MTAPGAGGRPDPRSLLVAPSSGPDALIERLSEKVHQAWESEKQRQGFADHTWETTCWDYSHCDHDCTRPGCKVGRKEQHHTDMLPYADLPENVKEYDRATVRAVLAAIQESGYQTTPATQGPATTEGAPRTT